MRLVVQLPELLQRSAEQLAAELDAVIVNLENHVAANSKPPGGEDATRRAAFLAEHCHLVIAISDRRETAPADLAGQVIRFRLQGIPDQYSSRPLQLDSSGLGSVYHVVAGKDDADATKSPTATLLRPQVETVFGKRELEDAAAWDHLERFNRDVARQSRRRGRKGVRSMFPEAVRARGSAGRRENGSDPRFAPGQPLASRPDQDWIGDRFAAADALAVRFQQATHRTVLCLLLLGIVAALAFQLSGVFPRAAAVYTASLALAYGVYMWAYCRRYEPRFYDYRALAEGLRVQVYWNAAGITACASDHYLRRQRSELIGSARPCGCGL